MGCGLNTDLGQRIQYVPSKQLLWLWAFVQAAVWHAVLNNSDWKVEKFKTDCGTIHPEVVGPKSMSLALRVSSNTRAKKRPSELQVQSSSSEVLAEDSERWVIPNSMAHGGHLMRENRQVPKCNTGEPEKASRPDHRNSHRESGCYYWTHAKR